MVETLERPQDIDGHCHCPEPDYRHASDSEDLQLQDPSNDSASDVWTRPDATAAAAAATVHCFSGSTQAGCTETLFMSLQSLADQTAPQGLHSKTGMQM